MAKIFQTDYFHNRFYGCNNYLGWHSQFLDFDEDDDGGCHSHPNFDFENCRSKNDWKKIAQMVAIVVL